MSRIWTLVVEPSHLYSLQVSCSPDWEPPHVLTLIPLSWLKTCMKLALYEPAGSGLACFVISSTSFQIATLICCCSLFSVFTSSLLFLLAWSSWISISFRSVSIFFLSRSASARPLASASRLACKDSIARWWFFLQVQAEKALAYWTHWPVLNVPR